MFLTLEGRLFHNTRAAVWNDLSPRDFLVWATVKVVLQKIHVIRRDSKPRIIRQYAREHTGLASRNIVHLQKIIPRKLHCIGFCFCILHFICEVDYITILIQRIPVASSLRLLAYNIL